MMNEYWRDGIDKYIDDSIQDPKLREFDWNIAAATVTHDWAKVLIHKWRRVVYIQKG
jgi:hypothetical protein